MITWRDETRDGFRDRVAMLGEVEVGRVRRSGGRDWHWRCGLPGREPRGYCDTRDAAKAAIEQAVAEWVKRAGLVKDEGWLPIESAPKSDKRILVQCGQGIVAARHGAYG